MQCIANRLFDTFLKEVLKFFYSGNESLEFVFLFHFIKLGALKRYFYILMLIPAQKR